MEAFCSRYLDIVETISVLDQSYCNPIPSLAGYRSHFTCSAGVQPYALGPDYSAAKAAIINLSISLSKDLAGTGITANTISPGTIMTAGFEQLWRDYAKTKGWGNDWNEIERNVVKEVLPNPTGRVGRIEEVASLVALVASPNGGFINGANLRVDGGYVVSVN